MRNELGIICSSRSLREFLDDTRGFVGGDKWEFYLNVSGTLMVEGCFREFMCETKGNTRRIKVKKDSVWRLLRLLDTLSDQPITFYFTDYFDGCIFLKEAIL